MRKLRLVLVIAIGVALTFPLPTVASATGPAAPQTFVIDLLDFATACCSGAFASTFNFSFTLSPEDPNQTTGAFQYAIYESSEGCPFPCAPGLNLTLTPIPGRPSWVWADFSGLGDTGDTNRTFQLTATNLTSGPEGGPSCGVNLDLSSVSNLTRGNSEAVQPFIVADQYHACGFHSQLQPPSGVAALVESAYSSDPHFGSVTNVTWLLSPDDPNASRGDFDYYLFHRYTDPVSSNPACSCHRGLRDHPNASDPEGLRVSNVSGFDQPGTFNNLWLEVVARDNLTHQQSVKSCVVVVSEGVRFSGASCGGLTSPSGSFDSSAPAFPFIDVGTTAPAWGLSVTSFALILAGMFMLACALAGFFYAGRVGAVCMSILSLAVDALWNLLPLWVLVLVFLVGVSFIVLSFRGGGGKTE